MATMEEPDPKDDDQPNNSKLSADVDHEDIILNSKPQQSKSSKIDPLKVAETELFTHLKNKVILEMHRKEGFYHKFTHLFTNGDLNQWRFYRLDTFDLTNHTIAMSYFITVKGDYTDIKKFNLNVHKVLRSRLPEEKSIKQGFGSRMCHDEIEMVL